MNLAVKIPSEEITSDFAILDYRPWHLRRLALQPSNEYLAAYLDGTDQPELIAKAGPAWTAWASGEPIACGGFWDRWEGRTEAWAIVGLLAAPHTLRLCKAIRRGIALHPAERVEATTDAGHEAAGRFAQACGFRCEGVARRYCRGVDHVRWVVLKPSSGISHTPV